MLTVSGATQQHTHDTLTEVQQLHLCVRELGDWAADAALSFTARGILAQILASPAGQPVSVDSYLSLTWKEGYTRVAGAFRELAECGYLHHVRKRGEGGRAGTLVVVCQPPVEDCGNSTCADCAARKADAL